MVQMREMSEEISENSMPLLSSSRSPREQQSRITSRCMTCFAQLTRVQAPVITRATGQRQIHAFRASSSVFAKKSSKRAEAAIDEFEEDVIEDIDETDSVDPSPNSPSLWANQSNTSTGAVRQARYAAAAEYLQERLPAEGISATRLKSNLPSQHRLLDLIHQSDKETIENSLEIFSRWRKNALPVPPNASVALMNKLTSLGQVDSALRVLEEKTKFGVEPSSETDLKKLSKKLLRRKDQENLQRLEKIKFLYSDTWKITNSSETSETSKL